MKTLTRYIDNKFYPEFKDNWDDLLFREKILVYLRPESVVLDVGAGAGIVQAMHFQDIVREIYGVDPDPRVADNPHLTKGIVGSGDNMPFFQDNMFDVVFCDNVLEHIADGDAFFKEVRRVLKPGGIFLVKTPNLRHYMPLIASLTPDCFHKFYNRLRGRSEDDSFPTIYRINTRKQLRRVAEHNGFEVVSIEATEGRPEYMRLSPATYFFGFCYERIVNRLRLDEFKILLSGIFRKA